MSMRALFGVLGLLALLVLPALSGCDSGEDEPLTCTSTDLFAIRDTTAEGTETGDTVSDGSCVSVAYIGRRAADGVEFDRGSGFKFYVGQGSRVISGFWLGVRGQKVGETRIVTIPPSFGYGTRAIPDQGERPGIPACSTLEFEITVEDILGASAC